MVVNNLFNPKKMDEFIQKYSDNFNLSSFKWDPINSWIKKLENNELYEEESNYSNFVMYILDDLLGYGPEDFTNECRIGDEKRPVDYALIKDGKYYVAIELKGTSTPDITKRKGREISAVEQVALYATEREETRWAIASNYDEFRLFDPNSRNNFISFRFNELLDKDVLKQFLLIFSKFSLIENDIPNLLLKETIFIDEKLEDDFYNLYSETRLMLIKELQASNIIFKNNKNLAIKYAQVFLNRYIFICFAEDLYLIPKDISIKTILDPILNRDIDEHEISDRLFKLFKYLDKGNEHKGIDSFNGGLFKKDLSNYILRDIVPDSDTFFEDCFNTWNAEFEEKIRQLAQHIPDLNPIYINLMIISSFDFSSQLDTNILGHIFENSIGDLEILKNKEISKQKEDGVFYTRPYLTEYICKNTIIPYLSKSGNVNTVTELIDEYIDEIDILDEKLKNIKIIDIACGSGAFLNKATDILLEIHENIFYIKYHSDNSLIKYYDDLNQRKEILLNNIFGVDLNEESVEITKLSMFLKVAKKGLKLPNLDKNIKCGNSLVNSPLVSDKYFNWKLEFKEVFDEGGFDIIVGNPPWGSELSQKEQEYISEHYHEYEYQINSYVIFMEKSFYLLKDNGRLGFIVPSSWLYMFYFKNMRKFIVNNTIITTLIHLKYFAFEDVIAESSIFCYSKSNNNENNYISVKTVNDVSEFLNKNYDFVLQSDWKNNYVDGFLLNKKDFVREILDNYDTLNDFCTFSTGIKPYQKNKGNPKQTEEMVKNKVYNSTSKVSQDYYPYLVGANIYSYRIDYPNDQWIKYGDCLAEPRKSFDFTDRKIIIRQTSNKIIAAIDNKQFLNMNNAHDLIIKEGNDLSLEYILALLNSKLLNYIYGQLVPEEGSVFSEVKIVNLKKLPVPLISLSEQKMFIEKVNEIIDINVELQEEINNFKKWLKRTFNIEKLSKKLEYYYLLDFETFLQEVKKKKVNTNSRNTQNLLESEFNGSLNIIHPLQKDVSEIDKDINQLVYELYDINEENRKIIENN